jgi:hypothetical protein
MTFILESDGNTNQYWNGHKFVTFDQYSKYETDDANEARTLLGCNGITLKEGKLPGVDVEEDPKGGIVESVLSKNEATAVAEIKNLTLIKDVEDILKAEQDDRQRREVIDAANDRLAQLRKFEKENIGADSTAQRIGDQNPAAVVATSADLQGSDDAPGKTDADKADDAKADVDKPKAKDAKAEPAKATPAKAKDAKH